MFETGKEEVAYLADIDEKIPSNAVSGNLAAFGPGGTLADSGKKPSDFATPTAVTDAVGSALSEAWDAMSGEYAVAAYKAPAWESGGTYAEGSFCKYGGNGYVCTAGHVAGESFSEDSGKWKKVLTASGASALDAMLSAIVSDKSWLDDLASDFSGTRQYSVNQLVKKDGALKICTGAGLGDAAVFSAATVEQAIQARYDALVALIPGEPGEVVEWLRQASLDADYDEGSPTGYSVNDTCTHGGRFWICVSATLPSEEWDDSKWREVSFREYVGSGALQKQPNWAEADSSDPSYVRNKPDIPAVDDTLSVKGDAADAKEVGVRLAEKADADDVPLLDNSLSLEGYAAEAHAVGVALADKASADSLPYKIRILGGTTYSDPSDSSSPDDSSSAPIYDPNDPTKVRFELEDRTINVVETTMSGNLDTIVLTPPPSPGAGMARDFFVVFHVASPVSVSVDMEQASLKDYAGGPVELSAVSETAPSYRFTEISRYGSVFLVTCMADRAYTMVREIDRALDDILEGLGETPDFEKGVYIPDEHDSSKLYRLVAVKVGGEVNIGVEQDPVEL